MKTRSKVLLTLLGVGVSFCAALPAEARPARCSTTNEGSYACDFQPTGNDGSFRISAPGKPTYIINVIEPGVGSAFVNYGTRNVFLSGRYVRQQGGSGCWVNFENRSRICAR